MNSNYFDNIDLNLFKVFLAVAETESISNAAKKLYVTQPAISRNIKELENILKVKLFIRKSRGVVLTQEGEKLLFYVKKAFNSIYSGERMISSSVNMDVGEIKIGVPSHIGSAILTDCITQFNKQYPNIKFVICNKGSHEIMEMLDSKELDMIIDSYPIAGSKDLIDTYNLIELNNCFIANKSFSELLKEMPLSIKRLKELPLILPINGSTTRTVLEEQLNFNYDSFNPIIEVYSSELLIDFVKNGIGIGYCPRNLVNNLIKSGEFIEVFTEIQCPTTQICLVYSPRFLTPPSLTFINLVKRTINSEYINKSINILNNKTINLDPTDISYLYNIVSDIYGIQEIKLTYEDKKTFDYIKELSKLKSNIFLNINSKNLNEKDIIKYNKCSNISLNVTPNEISLTSKDIFINNKNLGDIVSKSKCKFTLEINIKDVKSISPKTIHLLILACKNNNITLQFNEPFVDVINSLYTLSHIEKPIKEIGYVQSSQNVNYRTFSYKGHNIVMYRNFCAVCSSKFNPEEYCNKFNSLNLSLNGKIQICPFKNTSIDITNITKKRNKEKLINDFNKFFKQLGQNCKYSKNKESS